MKSPFRSVVLVTLVTLISSGTLWAQSASRAADALPSVIQGQPYQAQPSFQAQPFQGQPTTVVPNGSGTRVEPGTVVTPGSGTRVEPGTVVTPGSGTREMANPGSGTREMVTSGSGTRGIAAETFEQKFWNYLVRSKYRNWAPVPGKSDKMYEGESPHGAYLKMYLNRTAAGSPSDLPTGSIVIKENYGKDQRTLMAVTVMYKNNGYSPSTCLLYTSDAADE